MKFIKLLFVFIILNTVIHSQSSVVVGPGASINLGAGTNLAAGSRSGTFSGTGTFNGGVLPVELTTFEGIVSEEGVLLNWETATEVNNYGFDIERASTPLSTGSEPIPSGDNGDNMNGVEEWETIGFVQGSGTSNSLKEYSFTDTELPVADEVSYRLKQIDNDGTFTYSKSIQVDLTTITGVDDEEIPIVYSLSQNYPNPFNPTTMIKFGLPESGFVSLSVYNILGELVSSLVNQEMASGYHEVEFGANNLSSGMYVYRISIGNKFTSIKKMLMIK